MGLELAKAFVTILPDASRFGSGVAAAQSGIVRSVSSLQMTMGVAAGNLVSAGIMGAVNAAVEYGRESIEEAAQGMESSARLAAVLKATGNAAGYSAAQLEKHAAALQSSTTFGDEAIKDSMSKLATFKKVQGDVFRRATEAALDLASVGFGSAESAAVQLGKALEDPVRGVSALARSGVTFTEAEKAKIKQLVESNRLLDAQKVILQAVENQVQGVARAVAQTPAGRLQQLANESGELKEALGKDLLPVFVQIREQTLELQKGFTEFAIEGIRWGQVLASDWGDSMNLGLTSVEFRMSQLLDWMEDIGLNTDKLFKTPEIVGLSDKAAARVKAGELDHLGKSYGKREPGTPGLNTIRLQKKLDELAQPLADKFTKIGEEIEAAQAAATAKIDKTAEEESMQMLPGASQPAGMRSGFYDLIGFGRYVQESLLSKDNTQAQILAVGQQQLAEVKRQTSMMERHYGTPQVALLS